jgi:hypothetical protein
LTATVLERIWSTQDLLSNRPRVAATSANPTSSALASRRKSDRHRRECAVGHVPEDCGGVRFIDAWKRRVQ